MAKHFNKERNREFVVKNDIEIRLMKDWTVNADYSYLYRNYEFDSRRVPVPYSQYEGVISWMDPAQQSIARDQYARRVTGRTTQIYNVFTTYSPSFGPHNLKIMLGLNGEIYHNNSLKAERYDLLSTELSSFNLATGEIPSLVEDLASSVPAATSGVSTMTMPANTFLKFQAVTTAHHALQAPIAGVSSRRHRQAGASDRRNSGNRCANGGQMLKYVCLSEHSATSR